MRPDLPTSCLSLVLLVACGSTGGAGTSGPGGPESGPISVARGAVIVVENPTRDSWDLVVGGQPRGSVAPGSRAELLGIARGPQTVTATNDRLGLEQKLPVQADPKAPATVVLRPMLARLRVKNPHPEAVVIAVAGMTFGTAPADSETVFEGVPAGKRVIMLRSSTGPGAVRVEKMLPADAEAALTVPALDATDVDPNAPRAPEGKGLVRMRNASRNAVTLFADGKDHGIVPAGAVYDLVLEPGAHRLEVRIEGIDARTEHTVTLLANQVAEWVWGAEPSIPPEPNP